jgi:hypothetical protein
MISSLIAGLVVGLGQDIRKDYKLPVMPIRQFGEWLGKETGREVIVLPQVQDRLVYINVKNRTLPEVLGFVKEAIGVGVIDKNGVITLADTRVDSGGGRVKRENIEKQMSSWELGDVSSADLEAGMKRSLQLQQLQRKPGYNFSTKDYQESRTLESLEPTNRALRRIVVKMGIDALLKLPEKERVVFSTQPTRLQRAWIGDAAGEMKRITQGMQVRNDVLDQLPKNGDSGTSYFYSYSRLAEKKGGMDRPIVGMLLVVMRESYGFSVSLRAFDGKGTQIGRADDQITGIDQTVTMGFNDEFEKYFENDTREMVLSEADLVEAKRINLLMGYGQLQSEISRDDLEWLSNVDVVEPYGGLVSRIFDFGSEIMNNEVVTEVTVAPSFSKSKRVISAKDAVMPAIAYDLLGGTLEIRKDSLIIGKGVPEWYYETMIPRRSLAMIARHIRDKGVFTFDELADSVAELPQRNQMSQFIRQALTLSKQGGNNAYVEPLGWSEFMLLAYASFTPAQRKAVFSEKGLRIGLNQLSKKSQDYFWETARHAEFNIGDGYFSDGGALADLTQMNLFPKDFVANAWTLEQTHYMSLPSAQPIILEFSSNSQTGLLVRNIYKQSDGEDFNYDQFQDIEQYVRNLVVSEMAQQQGITGFGQSNGATRVTQNQMKLQVYFGGFKPREEQLAMFKDPTQDMVDDSKLPEDVRKQIEELKAKYREEYKNMTFGRPAGSGSVPPPQF